LHIITYARPGGNLELVFTHRHSQWEIPGVPERRWPWYHTASRQPASLNGTGPPEYGALSFICTVPYPLASATERPLGVSIRNAVPLILKQKVKLFFISKQKIEFFRQSSANTLIMITGFAPSYFTYKLFQTLYEHFLFEEYIF